MSLRMILAALGLALLAPAIATPAAHADTLHALFENTLTLTDARGRVTAYLFSSGGMFEQSTSTGAAAGDWHVRDTGQLCLQAERATALTCLPSLPADKSVGDTWEVLGPTGRAAFTARIVEGRIRLDGGE